ncbi:unnamed protein product, partial [Prorocentrum cordatum]
AAMIYDNVDIAKNESSHQDGESALVVEAKALYDATQKESITSFQDERTGIEGGYITSIKEGDLTPHAAGKVQIELLQTIVSGATSSIKEISEGDNLTKAMYSYKMELATLGAKNEELERPYERAEEIE